MKTITLTMHSVSLHCYLWFCHLSEREGRENIGGKDQTTMVMQVLRWRGRGLQDTGRGQAPWHSSATLGQAAWHCRDSRGYI